MTKFYAPFLSSVVRAFFLAAALAVTASAHATLYWDANSTLGGNGAWDNGVSTVWSTTNTAGAPNSTWTPNDGTQDAVFNGSASYTATVAPSTTINAHSVAFGITAGNVTITGGDALNIADPTNSFVMNTNASGTARQQIVNTPIAGTNISVFAANGVGGVNAFLALGLAGTTGPTSTFSGDMIFTGPNNATSGFSQIAINHPNALPSTATVRMKRNLSQLLFGGAGAAGTTSYSATFNNNIVLNDNAPGTGRLNSDIGAGSGATFANNMVITLGGIISGDANLAFRLGNSGGGQGKIVIANHATYTGTTTIATNAAGIVALGIVDAFPVGTTLIANTGKFDMAGFSQRVSGLSGGSNGVISNTGATISTLTIDGSFTGTYAGKIGASGAGTSDNEQLVLASTNTGTLTLSTAIIQSASTYSGGTTINGGKLLVSNDVAFQFSGTGSGAVTVNSGGTLGGAGGIGVAAGTGSIAVNSGGHLAPGLSGAIGTLTAFNALTLTSGSRLDIDLGAPAPTGGTSDRIDMPNTLGNFALTVPAAASSVGVNLGDPAGGAAGNGTYTLMTFQAGQYTGSTNASPFFTSATPSPNSLNGATIAYHLADGSNNIVDGTPASATKVIAIVSGGPNALLWTGQADGNWVVGGANTNFTNLDTNNPATFANNDNVTFDDAGANTNPITVAAGGVQPNIVTFKNATATYTLTGADIKGSSIGGGGGLFMTGNGNVTIGNNYTAAGPVNIDKGTGSVALNGAITAATSLTVNTGTVTLGGANTYAGNNTVNNGSLTASGAAATFGTGNVTVNAGTIANPSSAVILAGVANAIADSATLTLLGGGAADTADTGFINLGAGINEHVASLVLGTTTMGPGTYGATGSGATNFFNEYFLGTGIVTVGLAGDYNNDGKVDAADYVIWRKGGSPNPNSIADYNTWRANFGKPPGAGTSLGGTSAVPEPASCAMLLMGCVALLGIRRNKSARAAI